LKTYSRVQQSHYGLAPPSYVSAFLIGTNTVYQVLMNFTINIAINFSKKFNFYLYGRGYSGWKIFEVFFWFRTIFSQSNNYEFKNYLKNKLKIGCKKRQEPKFLSNLSTNCSLDWRCTEPFDTFFSCICNSLCTRCK